MICKYKQIKPTDSPLENGEDCDNKKCKEHYGKPITDKICKKCKYSTNPD